MTTTTPKNQRSRGRHVLATALRAAIIDHGDGAEASAGSAEPSPTRVTSTASDGGGNGGNEGSAADAEQDCSSTLSPKQHRRVIPLYDPADVERAIGTLLGSGAGFLNDEYDAPFDGGPEETSRLRLLRSMRDDPRDGLREAIVGTDAMAARVAALRAAAPHFGDYLDLVERAILFSSLTLTPLQLPPVLLVGSPGIGKTHTLRRLAEALGCASSMLSMTQFDAFRIHGQNTCWRNARVGIVAAAMLESGTIQNVFLLDEFEKPVLHGWAQRPHDVFHQLLEPENAASFTDEFLEVPMHLEHAIWVASANSTEGIPPSILDRLLVLHIPDPAPAHMQALVDAIYAEACDAYGGMFAPVLSADVRQALAGVTPRQMRRLLALALPFTRIEHRIELSLADVERASELMLSQAWKNDGQRVGFFSRLNMEAQMR